jgi:hypothetical protein
MRTTKRRKPEYKLRFAFSIYITTSSTNHIDHHQARGVLDFCLGTRSEQRTTNPTINDSAEFAQVGA